MRVHFFIIKDRATSANTKLEIKNMNELDKKFGRVLEIFRESIVLKEIYMRSYDFARLKNFIKISEKKEEKEELICIDQTSQTMMDAIFAKTEFCPDEDLTEMRRAREEAFLYYFYIYFGNISLRLKGFWDKKRAWSKKYRDKLIHDATMTLMSKCTEKLLREGYKKGKLHHLFNKALKNIVIDLQRGYLKFITKEVKKIVAPLPDPGFNKEDFKRLYVAINEVKTRRTKDDKEIFYYHFGQGMTFRAISEEMGIPQSTVGRRAKSFLKLVKEKYKEKYSSKRKGAKS